MKVRRIVVVSVILIMLVGTFGFANGQQDGTVKTEVVKFSTTVAPDHPNNIAALKFAEIVNNESGGRLKVEVFPANQLGNAKDVIELVMTGSVHMYMSGTAETSLFQPEFGVMDCPYLFRDFDHLMKVSGSSIMQEFSDKLEKNRGVKILTAQFYYGTRHLTTKSKPIYSPADLEGMLVRAPDQPIYLEAVRAMGATPTPVAFSDLYMALKQGVVDGQENPIPTIYTYKYYEAQKYIMLTGHMKRVQVIGVSASWFNGLSDDLKEIINKAIAEAVELNNDLTLKQEDEMLEQLKAEGMEVIEPNVELFRKAAMNIPEKFKDVWGEDTVTRIRAIQ